jgi:hypothetical protein
MPRSSPRPAAAHLDHSRKLAARRQRCFIAKVEWSPSGALIAFAALASFVALVQTVRIWWAGFTRHWTIRARARRAVEGELRAEPLLGRAGYEVVARQARRSWTVYADGVPLEIGLRADLLVVRGGRSYVAEVKTGKVAPRLDHAATRRQLLEYRIAFGVDGVLLVDPDAEKVTVVELGTEPTRSEYGVATSATSAAWISVFLVGAAIGIAAGWVLHP